MDTSVIVPSVGDAATGATGEPAILNGGRLATVCRWAVHGRFDRVDRVAVTVEILNQGDGVIQRVLHHVHGGLIDAVSEGEAEVGHVVLCVLCVL